MTSHAINMAYVVRGVGGRGFVLIHKGFRYQRNKVKHNKITWRCYRAECRANLETSGFDVADPAARIRMRQVCLSRATIPNCMRLLY